MKFKKIVSLFAAATMAVSSFAGLSVTASAAVNSVTAEVGTIYKAGQLFKSLSTTDNTDGTFVKTDAQKTYYTETLGAPFGAESTVTWDNYQQCGKDANVDTDINYNITTKGTYTFSVFVLQYGGRHPHISLDGTELVNGTTVDIAKSQFIGTGGSRNLAIMQVETDLSVGPHTFSLSSGGRVQGVMAVVLNGEGDVEVDSTPEPTKEPVVSSDVMPDFKYTFSGSNSTDITDIETTATYYLDKDGKAQSEASNATVTVANVKKHDSDHGLNPSSGATFSFRAQAPFKIVAGTCTYGGATGQLTVKDTSGNTLYTSETLSLVNACYKNDTSEVVEFEYTGTGIVDVVFSNPSGGYLPYLAKESLEPEVVPVTLKYNSSDIIGGNPNGNSAEYSFVSGVDANVATFFDSASDSTKLDANLVSGYKNYITGTDERYGSPSVKADLPAGSYKIYFLGYNHGREVNATIASTGETVVTTTGVEFATTTGSNTTPLKLYTLEFTLDADVTDETITFDSTVDQWLPDLFAIVITNQEAEGEIVPTPEPAVGAYSATWQFARSAGAPDINSERVNRDLEYTINVNGTDRTLLYNTANGKFNNTSRQDDIQCNAGTVIKLPAYVGMKISWNTSNYSGFTIDGVDYTSAYIYTGTGNQVVLTALGTWLQYIKVEPVTVSNISGKLVGAETLESGILTFTGKATGYVYTTTVSNGAYSIALPSDTYSIVLSDCAYTSTTETYTVNGDSDSADIICAEASIQTVTGELINPPAEALTLTFTAKNDATHNATVAVNAGATSYSVSLYPDTYTVASSAGTLSPLSLSSFQVINSAATKNLYYPEVIPNATASTVTVYKDQAVSGTNYHTITDAITGLKNGNMSNPTIILKSGETYQEQVRVQNLNNLTLKTDGDAKATITWYYGIGYSYYSLGEDGYYDKDRAMTKVGILSKEPDRWGAVVRVQSDNFKAENIIFENSFNQRFTPEEIADGVKMGGKQFDRVNPTHAADSREAVERAAAIALEGKGAEIYNCEFISSQDTFFTGGTAYIKDSSITGNTDYIFGGGSFVFDNCDLIWGGYSDEAVGGHITASSTGGSDAGYIFRDCTIKDGNRIKAAGSFGRDWGGVNAHVYFLNCKDETEKGVSGWSNMGNAVSAGTADLHVYDFSDPASYTSKGSSDKYNITAIDFAAAKAKYENVIDLLGFTPEKMVTAVTTKEALSNADEDRKDTDGTYVYGVVTTIKQGSDASIDSITWTVKSGDSTYSFNTSDTVDGKDMLNKGTFPTISGEGTAEVAMLFHAKQGTYEVVSHAE